MGKFDGFLFCADFDGTLAWSGVILPQNAAVLRRFMAEGGRFTVCSGRYVSFLKEACTGCVPNAPLISLNGSIITNGDSILFRGFLREQIFPDILQMLAACPEVEEVRLYNDREDIRFQPSAYHPEEAKQAVPEPLKLILIVPTNSSDQVTERLHRLFDKRYWIGRSWPNGIEIQEHDCSKGMAVRRLKELLHARVLVCAGDYENDLPMIQAADIGYAMGDAIPLVKASAHRVTLPCRENGVAAIVEELEREF